MTNQKLYDLLDLYETKLKEAGYEPGERIAAYSLVGTDDEQKASVGHIFWMINESKSLIKLGRMPKAMRWLGWVQHAIADLKLFTLEEIKDQAKNADEFEFPPPLGLPTMQAKIVLTMASPFGPFTVLVRQTWLPVGVHPEWLKFPSIDPDGRLKALEDQGIQIHFQVSQYEWDYTDLSLNVHMRPIMVHPRLSEESVALVVGLLKNAGWGYKDDEAKNWPERWAKVKELAEQPHSIHGPLVPGILGGILGQLFQGGMPVLATHDKCGDEYDNEDEEDELAPSPKKKAKKKQWPKKEKPNPEGGTDAGEAGGSPDAGGPQG